MRSSVFVFLLIVNQISQFRSQHNPYLCKLKHLKLIREKIRFVPFSNKEGQFILNELTIHFVLPELINFDSDRTRYLLFHLPHVGEHIHYTGRDVLGLFHINAYFIGKDVYAFHRELDENEKFKLSEKAELISRNDDKAVLDTAPFKPLLGDISEDTKIYAEQYENTLLILKYDLNDTTPQLEYQFLSNVTDQVDAKLVENSRFKLKFFTLNHEVLIEKRKESKHLNLYFTFIDENFDFHFEFQFWDLTKSKIDRNYTGPFSLERLLSCPVKPKSESELKGIFFDRRTNKFNIIINFLYLEIDRISSDKFQIDDELYSKAGYLKMIEDRIKFEHINTKWIKNLNQSSYLVSFRGWSYDLNRSIIEENGNARTMSHSVFTILKLCDHQTFQVQDHIFCFDEEHYWHLVKIDELYDYIPEVRNYHKQKIETIFDGLPELNFGNQKLKFIFNHNEEDKYVFMTDEYLLIFDYTRFETRKIITQKKNYTDLKYDGDKNYEKIRNSWLKAFHSPPSNSPSKGSLLELFKFLSKVICVIILLISVAFLVKRGFHEKISSRLNSNQPKYLSSDDTLPKKKFPALNETSTSESNTLDEMRGPKKSEANLGNSKNKSIKKPTTKSSNISDLLDSSIRSDLPSQIQSSIYESNDFKTQSNPFSTVSVFSKLSKTDKSERQIKR